MKDCEIKKGEALAESLKHSSSDWSECAEWATEHMDELIEAYNERDRLVANVKLVLDRVSAPGIRADGSLVGGMLECVYFALSKILED